MFPALWLSARGVRALLALAVLLAFASVVPALLYVLAVTATLVVAFALADAALGPSPDTVRLRRTVSGRLVLGRPAQLTYEVENRGRVAVRIGVLETPLATIDFEPDVVEATLAPRSFRTVARVLHPRERGAARFGAFYLWAENRVGLLRRRYRVEGDEMVRVFPDLAAVEGRGRLAKRNTLLDLGLRRLRLRGAGHEFESLREYASGDAFGLVDWKATARRGRLMVAQYEVERSQNVIVALDCGRLMTPRVGAQRKFDYALTAALSVARVAQAADDNVGLLAFAAKPVLEIAPRRGAAHYRALVQAAYDLQPRLEEPDYETLFSGLRSRHAKRSLIVVFTDIFDPVTSAAVLAGAGSLVPRHLVVCVLLSDAAIARALEVAPATPRAAYRTAVALTLADERATAVAQLRARGIIVVDVPAPLLTVALLDAYLDVKSRGLL